MFRGAKALTHPLWLTAQDWLESNYFKETLNPNGTSSVLFLPGHNQVSSEVFPIYPISELMFRVADGSSYQPYRCKETWWVFVTITDYSHDFNLKTIQQIKEREIAFSKYCRYQWSRMEEFESLGIDFSLVSPGGQKAYRSSVTHQELCRILQVPKLREIWEKGQERVAQNLHWHLETASKEMPVEVYAAGCDDASFTKLYATAESAMADIEKFKVMGLPDYPEREAGWMFTN